MPSTDRSLPVPWVQPDSAPSAAPTDAALDAQDELDSHRLEIHRLSAEVRRLEAELRAERHEHAETRARLARYESEGISPALVRALDNLSRAATSTRARQTAQQPRQSDFGGEAGKDGSGGARTPGLGKEGGSVRCLEIRGGEQ